MPKSVSLKLSQATKHLNALERDVTAFLCLNPFSDVREEEAATGDEVYRVRISQEIPERWSADVGDVLHNLRSALDHLACELVKANGQPVTKETAFPISDDAVRFRNHLPRVLAGAGQAAFTAVENARPYKGGNEDLWRLHQLDIIDKHRTIVPVCAAYKNLIVEPHFLEDLPPEFASINLNPRGRTYPLREGDAIFRSHASTRDTIAKFKIEFRFVFMVALVEPGIVDGEDLIETLRRLVTVTEGVVRVISTAVGLP